VSASKIVTSTSGICIRYWFCYRH